jgi:hypothetical protein
MATDRHNSSERMVIIGSRLRFASGIRRYTCLLSCASARRLSRLPTQMGNAIVCVVPQGPYNHADTSRARPQPGNCIIYGLSRRPRLKGVL